MTRRTYRGKKSFPENEHEVLVFGANTQGRHNKGAALTARLNWGAKYGQASGFQGQSYAIITKDLTQDEHPSISKDFIKKQIEDLYRFAYQYPSLTFYVAYSGTGTNLNGYSNEDMADLFSNENIPDNIVFEETFSTLVFK